MSQEPKTPGNNSGEDKKFPLPEYDEKDDIYNEEKEEPFEEDNPKVEKIKEKDKMETDDLDIPGTELDDQDEKLGEEDEENNYYSLGGDDKNKLDEDEEQE
jgi:hypothetical protein